MVGFGGKRTTTVEIEEAVEERFGAIDITLLEPGEIDHSESGRNNQSELIRNSQCTLPD